MGVQLLPEINALIMVGVVMEEMVEITETGIFHTVAILDQIKDGQVVPPTQIIGQEGPQIIDPVGPQVIDPVVLPAIDLVYVFTQTSNIHRYLIRSYATLKNCRHVFY